MDHYSLDDSGTVYSLDTGGIITPNIADHGDSGGPVFVIRDDGKAYMVGIISGGIDNENDSYTVFAPCYEIKLKLNVVPLLR